MICVSYTRSRIKFGEAISITEQNEKIAAFIKGRRMTIEKKYSDRKEDIDADEGFLDMKEAGINRKFDCIVFWSMMYFGKDPLVGYNLLRYTFIPAGIDFAVVCDNFFSVGHSLEEIEEYLNSKYKERRMEHENRIANIARDYRRNTLYGYEKHGDEFVIDAEVKPLVDEIFQMALDGKTVSQICKYLNDKKTECPPIYLRRIVGEDISGIKSIWDRSQVKKILTDSRYMGVRTITRKGIVSTVPIEPYITKEEYEQLQTVFRHYSSKGKTENPLAKKIFDKDSHIRLYMGDYLSNGTQCFYISQKTPEYAEYKKKVIPVQTVFDEVKNQINNEIKMAKHVATTFESESGKAEITERRKQETVRVKDAFNGLLESVNEFITPTEDEFTSEKIDRLDELFSQSLSHKRDTELALSNKNPWVKMYSSLNEIESITTGFCREYVSEILVDRFEKVILIPKHNEWKQQLPEYWLEV